jgi:trans-2-enoyl-CoA reductase
VLVAGFAGAQWQSRADSDERAVLIDRFPKVRAEERAACTREFTAQINGLTALNEQGRQALDDIRAQMEDTHDVVAYTLRFLGDRARLTDARQAALIKQTRQAAAAATIAAQKTEAVEQKVTVATAKAVEAASTAKAVDKKLDTAVRPPLPPQPWIGNRR